MPQLGLAVPIEGFNLRESLELAVRAEALGFESAWSYEVDVCDGFTPLGWLAARTERMRLGISLIPAPSRPPALLAMTASGLQDISGGRLVLGLGASSPAVMRHWMGLTHDRPLTRLRETVEATRQALVGGRVSYAGETVRIDGFRLGGRPAEVPILLGALGPKANRLAGAVADGLIMVFNVPERTPELLTEFYAGAEEAGRDHAELEVVSKVFVAVDEDLDALRPQLQRFVTGYAIVPAYQRLLRRQGFEAEMDALAAAWGEGRRADAAAAISDELLSALIVFGSPEQCAARLRAHGENGVDTLIIAPITAATEPAERRERIEHTVHQVASALTGDRSPAPHVDSPGSQSIN